MRSIALSTAAGPVLQLHPTASAPSGDHALRGNLGARAIEAIRFLVDRKQHDDLQLRGYVARGQHGLLCLVYRHHGLEHQQVDAAFRQRCNLFGEGGAGLLQAGLAQRLQPQTQRPHRAGHKRLGSLLLADGVHTLPGDGGAGAVELAHLVAQAKPFQPETIGAKGVGLDDLGACLQVLLVHGAHRLRLGYIQLVVAAVDEHATAVEHRAHGAVAQDGFPPKSLSTADAIALLYRPANWIV